MPGAIDSSGIYVYNETDLAAPGGKFSDLLNKLGDSIRSNYLRKIKRTYLSTITADLPANGATLATINLPILPAAARVMLGVQGTLGFTAAAGSFGIAIGASNAAGVIPVVRPANSDVNVPAGAFVAYSGLGYIDITTTGPVTITFKANGSAYYRLLAEVRILLAGEY